ncbi:MAG: amino acid adenylation domain-containing protein [Methylococcaceae bacterium]|nr:amino acid adenylation domain-containing protein [Methylococcaceae bacterium]
MPEAKTHKRAQLIALLRQNQATAPLITRRADSRVAPLSFAQEPLWAMAQLQPDNPIYNVSGAIELYGELDVTALQDSLQVLLERHEILHSRFAVTQGVAQQQAILQPHLQVAHLDLTALADSAQQAAFAEASAAFLCLAFDLGQGLPLRAMLVNLGEQRHILVLVVHHIVADRWSVGILLQELGVIYAAIHTGQSPVLPQLEIQYGDFAAWQRQPQQAEETAQHLHYWRQKWALAPAFLALPTDYARPAVQRYRGNNHVFRLASDSLAALKALAKQANATLFMVLAAGLNALLYRYTQSQDLALGYTTAGRSHAQTESVVGFFVNTLVLRSQVQGDLPFFGLLAQIRAQALDDQAHQAVSYAQLVEAVKPMRDSRHAPLFQVLLTVQNAPTTDLHLPSLQTRLLALANPIAQFDLTFLFEERDAQLYGLIEYNSDLFHPDTVARMAGHLDTLLAAAALVPHTPVAQLPLMAAAERAQILRYSNHPSSLQRPDKILLPSVHTLFSACAFAHPEKIAVVFADQALSYAELEQRANQLAHCLQQLGLGLGSRVGVSAVRSLELIVALLAVLKAGAAYVPLDPDSPEERLNYIIQDAGIGCLLTQTALLDKFRFSPCYCLALDAIDGDYPTTAPVSAPLPDSVAYLIYTSGSTGQPKGVLVSHRSLSHSTLARCQYYQEPLECFLLLSSFAFDSSVAGIFWPLTQGARLCLPQAEDLNKPAALAQLIARHQVSHLLALPSFYQTFCTDSLVPLMLSLRTVIVAGEACPRALAAQHHQLLPTVRFFNEYGPTEATVWSSVYQSTADASAAYDILPIGRAIDQVQLYILDAYSQLLPIGVAGELYIGGSGLSIGYLHQARLSAEKFIPNPFAHTGQRLYKTGDRARYLADGNIEFLGRTDQQVKIRGYRIELGEIEAKLAAYPGMTAAAVSVLDARLVAYCVPKAETTLAWPEVRRYLLAWLPEYMVPHTFVELTALPLNANGKLDRQSLPAPQTALLSDTSYQAPIGHKEQTLAQLWQSLLGAATVGRNDNFFELGGHSLLAISLAESLQQQGYTVDVQKIFTAPVLADMAAAIELDTADGNAVPSNGIAESSTTLNPEMLDLVNLSQAEIDLIVAAVPQGIGNIQDIYPLAPLQQGILFHHLLSADQDIYLKRTLLRFSGRSRLERFLGALQQVINRHDILRSAVFWQGLPQAVQVVHRHAQLPIHELQPVPGSVALAQLQQHTARAQIRMDLRLAPLFAAYVQPDSSSGECLLAIVNHHLVDDNYTLQLILSEIQQIEAGLAAQLPPPVPYRHFIALALAQPLAAEVAYFKAQLGDIDTPTAPYGVLDMQGLGSVHEAQSQLDAVLVARIRALARQQGVSPAVLFHLAWAMVLGKLTGLDDVVFGTVLLGRMHAGASVGKVLGMFINTLPVRIGLGGNTVAAVLSRTYQQLRSLLDHEQASLVLAQRCSRVAPPLPLFTTLFNYRHSDTLAAQHGTLSGWSGVELVQVEERTHYPIAISVDDTEQGFTLTAQCVAGIVPERLVAYLETAMTGLVAAWATTLQLKIQCVEVLPAAERQQILLGFNRTAADYPQQWLLQQLFEAQVRRTPTANALSFEGQSLSYAGLNQQANRLAHYLFSLGVRPDDRVALCLGRGMGMIVGLLGILKAGAAYVPLDPLYPDARLAYLLQDSQSVAVLVTASAHSRLQTLQGAIPLLVIEADPDSATAWAHCPDHNPDAVALGFNARQLAYVLYTSGSTGQPKGVMVAHESVVNLWAALAQTAMAVLPSPANMGLNASLSFDASVQSWLQLLSGHCVVIIPESVRKDGAALMAYLSAHHVDALDCTPAQLPLLDFAAPEYRHFYKPQVVLVGGEAISPEAWQQLQTLDSIRFYNVYGPTECTVDATLAPLHAHSPQPHIGQALANTQVYILDKQLLPVPLGVAGEIYISGAGLARAYLNRPELTAARFLPNPFSHGDSDTRLYKTGDLGCFAADGNISYLGRNDTQLKLRGYRIEPGEIEAVLRQYPGVKTAVVAAKDDAWGHKRLVAYIVAADQADLASEQLRAHLANSLPAHLLPSAYVRLAALPMTANGKLDRNALPMPDASAVVSRSDAPPCGLKETAMAQIWQSVLGLDSVSRHDHFFELGGHSLLIVTLVERLRTAGFSIDVRTVFTAPVLAEMAAALTDASPKPSVPANLITDGCTAITPELLPLVSLNQAEIDTVVSNSPLGVANIQDIYPLAPLQEGILFHHLLETQGDAYMLRSVLRFDTRNQLDRFLAALQTVINRHDILRTAIHWQGLPQPVQTVYRTVSLPISITAPNANASTESAAIAELLNLTEPTRVRLNLNQAPLFKAVIAPLPGLSATVPTAWLLALLNHHIVCDHLSLARIIDEIKLILQGLEAQLPPPVPYREFIAQSLATQGHEAYFRAQLADITEPTAPFGLLDIQGDGQHIAEATVPLAANKANTVRAVAKQLGISPAILFHAAWARVLAACTQLNDVVFGTVMLGRLQNGIGWAQTLGPSINTLPLRISLAGRSVAQVTRATQLALNSLLAHEHASLVLAQRCSGVAATLPLFTCLFNYRHNTDRVTASPEQPDLGEGIRFICGDERTNYPLTVSVDDWGQGFSITAQCDQGIDPTRIAQYLDYAVTAWAEALVNQPQMHATNLAFLPSSECKQLNSFNAPRAEYAPASLIHALFEAQVAKTPEAIAVSFNGQHLTYAALNQHANRLAHRLLALGVRPDDRVALCLERGLTMLVGLWGILKSGAAYVPLDPRYPPERLAMMWRDSQPVALITQPEHQNKLEAVADSLRVLVLDDRFAALADSPDHNPDPVALGLFAQHLAYIIYTSGSTGQPKGVMVAHHQVTRLFTANQAQFNFNSSDVWTLFHSYAFDFSVWEINGALLYGGRLVVVPYPISRSPEAFYQLLCQEQVTILNQTPSAFYPLIAVHRQSPLAHHLRCVVFGGEALAVEPLQTWIDCTPLAQTALINMYGITEITVHATYHALTADDICAGQGSIIGKPLSDLGCYLLDAHLQPVPLGAVGEIYISGAGLARGYLNRPDVTAARFIANPYAADSGGSHNRLYKTGDLARYLPDGTLVYLGRNDLQVKIRGHRIELQEIEAQLMQCPGVQAAAVVLRQDQPGEQRLVAYVVGPNPEALSATVLRGQLARVLADYQLPSAYVLMGALPLTVNGKLARDALPKPEDNAVASRPYVAPQGTVELTIAQLWQDLLHLQQVGRHDHFFELGGHSLLAVQLMLRLRDAFGITIPLATLFAKPTLAALAEDIIAQQIQQFESADVARIAAELDELSEEQLLAMLAQEQAADAGVAMPAPSHLS